MGGYRTYYTKPEVKLENCHDCGELKSTLTEIKELLQLAQTYPTNKDIYIQLILDILEK